MDLKERDAETDWPHPPISHATLRGDSPREHPSGGVLTFRKCYEIVFHDENILHELF